MLDIILNKCSTSSQVLILYVSLMYILYKILLGKSTMFFKNIGFVIIAFISQPVFATVCTSYGVTKLGAAILALITTVIWIFIIKRSNNFILFILNLVLIAVFPYELFR